MLKDEVSPSWEIKPLIEEVIQTIRQLENVQIEYNFLEANRVANNIANKVIDLEDLKIWENNFPSQFLELARNDYFSRPGF